METLFWSRFKSICAERGTTPTGVCKAIGLSTGNPPVWKRGTTPNRKIIQTIADYFGVNPSYFVGEIEKPPVSEETGASVDELKFALFGGGGEITDEMFEEVKAFARYVRAKNEGQIK